MKLFASLTAAATVALGWQVALDTTVKGLVLLLVTGGLVLLMRRQSASARHHVWLLAMTALLVLPVLSLTLPKWRILPASLTLQSLTTTEVTEASPAPTPEVNPEWPLSLEPLPPSVEVDEPVPTTPLASVTPATMDLVEPEGTSTTWIGPLMLIWSIGLLLLGGRMIASTLALLHLRRSGQRLTSGPLLDALTGARHELQYDRPVALYLDGRRTMPMSWGILGGKVLLPAEATTWSPSQLKAVLLHEVGHLKRRDPLVQVLVQAACALHWFNPLVWLSAWRLRVERERACDDLVLESGMRATDYAQYLLDVAAGYRSPAFSSASAVAMARQTRLEGRLRAIMSDHLNRQSLTRTLVTALSVLGAMIVLPFAMLQAQSTEPAPPSPEDQPTTEETEPAEGQLDYQPGTKPPAERKHVPKWGKTKNGLQAGVFFNPEKESYALGETIEVHTMVRNVSQQDHKFSINRGIRASLGLWVQDTNGRNRSSVRSALGGRLLRDHFHLQPGEEVEINKMILKFGGEHAKGSAGTSLRVEIGETYRGAITVALPEPIQDTELDPETGDSPAPANNEWVGELTSGKLAFSIAAPKPSTSLLEVQPIPPATLSKAERKRLLESLQEENKRRRLTGDPELKARIEQYEAAYRLQTRLGPLLQNADKMTPAELAKAIEELAVDTRAAVGINDPGIAVEKNGKMAVGSRGDNEIWKFETRNEVIDVSIIGGSVAVVIDETGTIYGVDLKTGELRWEQKSDRIRRLEGKQPKEPKPAPVDPEPAKKNTASAELIKTWTELVEARKLAELQTQRDLANGIATTTDLTAAQEAVIDAKIGHAKAAQLGLPQLAKLHEERVANLKSQEALILHRYKGGHRTATATEVQKARSRVIEARIKLLEVQKAIEETKDNSKGRPQN